MVRKVSEIETSLVLQLASPLIVCDSHVSQSKNRLRRAIARYGITFPTTVAFKLLHETDVSERTDVGRSCWRQSGYTVGTCNDGRLAPSPVVRVDLELKDEMIELMKQQGRFVLNVLADLHQGKGVCGSLEILTDKTMFEGDEVAVYHGADLERQS